MKILSDFIRNNKRIEIISNGGKPTPIPKEWDVLGSYDILVVIPDMHMYNFQSPLDNFKFGRGAMLHFLDYLGKLKEDMELQDKVLRIYQIGDIYEMRFPSITNPGANATGAEIRVSNPQYDLILNKMDSIRTHFIYGNHDFELRHYPSFRFGALEGKVYLEHGFAPSPWTENPNNPLWEPANWVFKSLRWMESFYYTLPLPWIDKDKHYAIGVQDGFVERGGYPFEADYPKEQREYYIKRITEHSNSPDCRICVIGHTHHPFLEAKIDGTGEGYVFIDAGAWTEGRSDFAVITEEEVAICRYKRSA